MSDLHLVNDQGQRISVGEDGKISVLARTPTGTESRAVPRPSDQQKNQSDEELGIASGPAVPTGRVFRGLSGDTNPFPRASEISAPPTQTATGENPSADKPLVKEDPIGTVIAGAGAAKAGAAAGRAIGGLVGSAVEGATVAGVPTLATTGDPKQVAQDALAGSVVSPILHALPSLPGAIKDRVRQAGNEAVAANLERVPTAVTGGARGAAAKKVIAAGDILKKTAEAHPDLQEALLTGDDAAKQAAIEAKTSALTDLQDKDIDQIAKGHPEAKGGRVPIAHPLSRLGLLAHEAHQAGDDELEDAAKSAVDSLRRFDEGGTISPDQLRTQRNSLARKIASRAPLGTPAYEKATRDAQTVKAAFNQSIEQLADETPGVDAAAHKVRNREIASLLPAQSFLEQQADAAKAEPVRGPLGRAVETLGKVDIQHPLSNVTKPLLAAADRAIPAIDIRLAHLAGPTGPAGVAALKKIVLSPTRESLQEAIRVGIPAQVALQVARLGAQQPVTQ